MIRLTFVLYTKNPGAIEYTEMKILEALRTVMQNKDYERCTLEVQNLEEAR